MIVNVNKKMVEELGYKNFEPYGLGEKDWSWRDDKRLNLSKFDDEQLTKLSKFLLGNKKVDGTNELARDIQTWMSAKEDIHGAKPKNVKGFESLLSLYLLDVDGHRIYRKNLDDVWLAYYVTNVRFNEPSPRTQTPPSVSMNMAFEDFGGRQSHGETFHFDDVRGRTVAEALLHMGYVAETPELRAAHLEFVAKFEKYARKVGMQFLATGTATDNIDGNGEGRRYRNETFDLSRDGAASRVVVDVFYEEDRSSREREGGLLNPKFWDNVKKGKVGDHDSDDVDDGTATFEPEVPLHPYCAIFDLTKHLRLRTHVNNLTEYVYDDRLSEKLILDPTMKALVELLVDHKDGGFKDIVAGKGGGAVILLGGPPGVGKTLTAEVYAESKHMPLYNVQCSQLGTDASGLEETLLKVFRRAKRWGAIVLLDEADVYVRERGEDIEQNAIVGVFLRVLEYQSSVLFLATNRPENVDDAISSRCLARLTYQHPNDELEAEIWRVLADGAGAKIDDETIYKVVESYREKHPDGRSGRDVKNLLKLAMLVTKSRGGSIGVKDIDFVERFRPWAK